MFFIIFMTLTSYTTIDIPEMMAQTAGRSSWIPILFTSVLFGISAVMIAKLNNMFLGKVFFDYSQEVIGKFFAYVIAVYFIGYFLMIGVYLQYKMIGVLASNFLPKTPKYILMFLGLVLFACVSYKGITSIARIFEIYGISFLVITLTICVFMIVDGDPYNILPLFNPSDVKEYANTMKDLIIPFGGLEVLLIIPFTDKNKKAPVKAFFSLLFIGFFYVLVVESTIMNLGINNTILLNDSFIEALKITEAPVIERLDIFYLTFGLTSLFSGMIIIFCAVVEYVCRIFSKVKRLFVVTAVGILFFVVCLATSSLKNISKTYESFMFYPIIISCFLIPLVILILAKNKKRTQKHSRKRAEQ